VKDTKVKPSAIPKPRRNKMESPDDLAIQGSAVAGTPSSIFAIDVTAAEVVCAECGARSALPDEKAYLHGPVSQLHCARCSSVLGRFRRSREAVWIDLRAPAAWQVLLPH
jgi:hypothetical protein